eukprot:c32649_g1_i1.p1 GENE.c32649_g1_i1~~c32649_g1_i1.p1  ORF type:complete len:477 (+),score=87.09 c32649_g1_i1:140-1570(+)
MPTRFEKAEVVVIGAGVSGLAAACALLDAGVSVIVLEADKRIGGRLLTHYLADGTAFDMGGQWIGTAASMPRVHAHLQRYGLSTFNQIDSAALDLSAHHLERLPRLMRAEWEFALAKLDDLAADVDPLHPAVTAEARALDAVSVEEWKRANLETPYLREVFDQIVRTEFTIEPKDVSMLYFLICVKTSGGIEAMFSCEGGSHSYRVVEGFAALCTRMAARLGARVLLEHQVYDVIHRDDGVRIVAENAIVEAKRVIMALPPNQIMRLDFDPVLPRRRSWLMQRLSMGTVIKCFALYARPFWRGKAVNVVDPETTVIDHTLDASSVGDKHHALVAFIGGYDAVIWSDKSADERRAVVIEGLAQIFGPEAHEVVDYFDLDWASEPHIGGGYSCFAPPGAVTAGYEELNLPIGPIHWAGTEMAVVYQGYVEGALQASERAVAEVLSALRPAAAAAAVPVATPMAVAVPVPAPTPIAAPH